jgi:hypothetical protein
MSDFLQQLFHGKAGDNALNKCYKTRETVELCEPQKEGTHQFDRELVRLWLIEKGHTQAWLGSQVGAHTGSVNRWLAGTLMPRSSHVEKINRLMRGEDIKSNKSLFRLSPALWEGLRVAAKAQGLSIDTFLKRLAIEIAEAIASANMNEDDN